jgi:hypothetical protein
LGKRWTRGGYDQTEKQQESRKEPAGGGCKRREAIVVAKAGLRGVEVWWLSYDDRQ